MAGFAGADDDELLSGINVTPLVDVVLVLLVIFMMTAPVIYQSSIHVQLPKAKSGEQHGEKNPLQFSLTKEGDLLWDKDKVTWEVLEQKLRTMGILTEQTALISADEATPHGVVIRLMDTLRKAGLTKFALNVDG